MFYNCDRFQLRMDYLLYVFISVLYSTVDSSATTNKWDVIASCGRNINISSDSGQLVLEYNKKNACPPCDVTMTFGPRAGYFRPRIAVYFTRFMLAGCDADHVDVFDGFPSASSHDVRSADKLNPSPLCGINYTLTRAGNHFMTSRDAVTVSFTRTNPSHETAIFFMYAVLVYETDEENKCSQNGFYPCNTSFCAPKSFVCSRNNLLKCNRSDTQCLNGDFNNNDGTTYTAPDSSGPDYVSMALITLAILIVLVALSLTLVCVIRNKCDPLFQCMRNHICSCCNPTPAPEQVGGRGDNSSNGYGLSPRGQTMHFNNRDQSFQLFNLPTYEEATETSQTSTSNPPDVFCSVTESINMNTPAELDGLPTYGESLHSNLAVDQTINSTIVSTSGYDRAPPFNENAPPPYDVAVI